MQLADSSKNPPAPDGRASEPAVGRSREAGSKPSEGDPSGGSLAEVMKGEGHLALRRSLNIFLQVAAAVSGLHGRGKAHGGISPEAVLLEDGRAFLSEDSAEREGEEKTASAWPGFRAPELCEDAAPDTRCDVYSLGVLLHWMLTGRVPRGGTVSGRLPERVSDVIAAAIQEDPDERTQTVAAMKDILKKMGDEELERLETELELAVSAAGFDPRLLWKKHRKAFICTVLAIIVVAVCGGWLYKRRQAALARQARQEQERREEEARIRSARMLFARATALYEDGKYADAAEEFRRVVEQDAVPELREDSLCYVARCYRELKDYGAEYGAWLRLLREYPNTPYAGEANNRIARIASLTLKRYGDLVRIDTRGSILIDGIANDWEGIEPIIEDAKGDNLRGGRPSDMVAFYAAVQEERIYFMFEMAESPREGDQFCVAIDLNAVAYDDSSEEWDYQLGVARGIPPWIWDLRGNRGYDNSRSRRLHGVKFAQKECVEFSVPLSALGNPCNASLRAFTNYKRQSKPNDMCDRKVLVEWCEREGQNGAEPASGETAGTPKNRGGSAEIPQDGEKNKAGNSTDVEAAPGKQAEKVKE